MHNVYMYINLHAYAVYMYAYTDMYINIYVCTHICIYIYTYFFYANPASGTQVFVLLKWAEGWGIPQT